MANTPGQQLRQAIKQSQPLQLLGILNPYMALALENAGFGAAYISGAGISNFNYGVPDVGIVELSEVAHQVELIRRVSNLALLVDADTGWEDPTLTVQTLIAAGAAGLHIEDQTEDKRCGHLEGKALVSTEEMTERIRKAAAGKTSGRVRDDDFLIMARTDALAVEGKAAALERIDAYLQAGAEAIFPEAVEDIDLYTEIREMIGPDVPLLANITEYGKTDLFTAAELHRAGVDIMLMPVSLGRAMHGCLGDWLDRIKETGGTEFLVRENLIRPRDVYYQTLGYDPKADNRDTVLAKLDDRKTK